LREISIPLFQYVLTPDAALNLIKAAHFYRLKMYYPVLFLFLLQTSPKRDFWRLVH
jgi:hypothetical protein